MSGQRRYFILIVVALMAIGLQVVFATAQQPTTSEIELVGFVEAMDATTITVNGQVINLTGAQLNTALSVGAAVEVEGTLDANGQITAREVEAASTFEPNAVEVTGVVQSFDGATLALAGLTINAVGAEFEEAGIRHRAMELRLQPEQVEPD